MPFFVGIFPALAAQPFFNRGKSMTTMKPKQLGKWYAWCMGACVAACQVHAQEETPPMTPADSEVKYVQALIDFSYTDFARDVITEGLRKYPAKKLDFMALEIKILLAEGQFNEAEKKINARTDKDSPETWAMRLQMAAYLLAREKYADADAIYQDFFKKFAKPDAAMLPTYKQAAYVYAQLLNRTGRAKDAVSAYDKLLAISLAPAEKRDIQTMRVGLALSLADSETNAEAKKKLIDDSEKIVTDLLWVNDNFFGDAVVAYARIKMLRGQTDEAQKIINDYSKQLLEIHDSLRKQDPDGTRGLLAYSPMPACRFLLGKLLSQAADKEIAKGAAADDEKIKSFYLGQRDPQTKKRNGMGAFNHFINVFANYPESQYALQAGEEAERISRIIQERYNTKIDAQISDAQKSNIRRQLFIGANVRFSEGKFKEAADAYLKALNAAGAAPESLPALINLVKCYITLYARDPNKDPYLLLLAETATGYLAETYSGIPALANDAGNTLIELTTFFEASNLNARAAEALNLFFRFYPSHVQAAGRAMNDAKKTYEEDKDADLALIKYRRIADRYPSDSIYRRNALIGIIKIYSDTDQFEKEYQTMQEVMADLEKIEKPGQIMAQMKLKDADAQRRAADKKYRELLPDGDMAPAIQMYAQAASKFRDLAKVLSQPNNPYQATEKEKEENKTILEQALFFSAECLRRIPAAPEKINTFRKAALKAYEDCLAAFPKGTRAPACLLQMGTIYTAMEDAANAQKFFDQLRREFPESDEARDSLPKLAQSLMDMGMRGQGVATYKRMFEEKGTYQPAQYMRAAEALVSAREYALGIEAYEKVITNEKAGYYIAQAMLGKAKAQLATGDAPAASQTVNTLLDTHGKQAIAIDAHLLRVAISGELLLKAKNAAARNALIADAKKSVAFVKAQRGTTGVTADLDLSIARLCDRRYQVEQELKSEKPAIDNARGSAIIMYDQVMMNGNKDPKIAAYVEDAYHEVIPLQLAGGLYKQAIENAEKYLELFPEGRYVTDIRNRLNQARLEQPEK